MYLVAFAAAWWLGRVRAKKPGSTWKPADIDDFMFFGMLGTILGGRIGLRAVLRPVVLDGGRSLVPAESVGRRHVVPRRFVRRDDRVRHFRRFAASASIADVFDFAAPLPGIGICAVRIGNFINGELWGKPTDVPWAFMVDGVPRHATQLYEAALEGIVLFVILWIYTAKPRPRMAPTGLFLVIYSLARIVVEFWRLPDEHLNAQAHGYLFGGWFTMGMLLSLPMLLVGATLVHGIPASRGVGQFQQRAATGMKPGR